MKKLFTIVSLISFAALLTAFINKDSDTNAPIPIIASEQRSGNADTGYQYLITGDYLKSGVPYKYFRMLHGEDYSNYLNRTGKDSTVAQGYNVVKAPNGVEIVIPTCLQCHSQVFNGKLYVGLGNTFMDFAGKIQYNTSAFRMLKIMAPKAYAAAEAFMRSFNTVNPQLITAVRGVNLADKLAAILVSHRDPKTLAWTENPILQVPDITIPTDVPAWWLLKKKNAMFYTGFGRGDFAKFLMASNLLTVSDTSEANEVNSHFGDVLAYIRSISPPKYPYTINKVLAAKGRDIFLDNCAHCHGTYDDSSYYPNYIIPESIIGTDSALLNANQQNKQFIDWFNNSWFASGSHPARLVASAGYVAPPLDGIWITAPYFHNGSVPTLEAVLNSKARPTYWERDFTDTSYDYDNVGWKYQVRDSARNKNIYNTTIPGYGNYGHYFGDGLSEKERKAVIEYLKTL